MASSINPNLGNAAILLLVMFIVLIHRAICLSVNPQFNHPTRFSFVETLWLSLKCPVYFCRTWLRFFSIIFLLKISCLNSPNIQHLTQILGIDTLSMCFMCSVSHSVILCLKILEIKGTYLKLIFTVNPHGWSWPIIGRVHPTSGRHPYIWVRKLWVDHCPWEPSLYVWGLFISEA